MPIVFHVLANKDVRHSKRVFEEKNAVGIDEPLFLASVYDGETIGLFCLVRGGSYEESRAYIETTLVDLFKAEETITIGPGGDIPTLGITVTGVLTELSYGLKPNNKDQYVNISMNAGYAP